MFNIQLYHGWVVDPEDYEFVNTVGQRTYNELVEELVRLGSSDHPDDVNKS